MSADDLPLQDLWLWCGEAASLPAGVAESWRSLDGRLGRAYRRAGPAPGEAGWQPLRCLQRLRGASYGQPASHHYVVETDVAAARYEEFDAWYRLEHLPGLAAVPGSVEVARYARQAGDGPRHVACYELTSPETLVSAPWLAVRGSPWSSRVRPWFANTVRTMHLRA